MQKCRILIGFYSIIIPCGNFLITSLFFFSLSLSPPIRCKHQTFRFEANIKCVHFDFIEVHYREVGAPQRERRFAGEKRIPRNCASHYSNGPRAHHAAIYTRLRTRTYARRGACTLHHASYE